MCRMVIICVPYGQYVCRIVNMHAVWSICVPYMGDVPFCSVCQLRSSMDQEGSISYIIHNTIYESQDVRGRLMISPSVIHDT